MRRIKDIMNRQVETVQAKDSADIAYDRMKALGLHHLVVVEKNKIVGILSERDLGGPKGEDIRKFRSARELMTPHPVTVAPDTTMHTAAATLLGSAIGCLPVLEGGKLVGIVTTSDLLELIAGP